MMLAFRSRRHRVPSRYPKGVTDYRGSMLELPHGGTYATHRAAFGSRSEVSLAARGITPYGCRSR